MTSKKIIEFTVPFTIIRVTRFEGDFYSALCKYDPRTVRLPKESGEREAYYSFDREKNQMVYFGRLNQVEEPCPNVTCAFLSPQKQNAQQLGKNFERTLGVRLEGVRDNKTRNQFTNFVLCHYALLMDPEEFEKHEITVLKAGVGVN